MHHEIEVLYFAVLQDFSQKTHEFLPLKSPMTPRTLYLELSQKYSFPLSIHQLRFAINHRFISEDTPLQSGDTVAFIPPVSGG